MLHAPSGAADEIVGVLAREACGAEVRPTAKGHDEVRIWFRTEAAARAARAAAARLVRPVGPTAAARIERFADEGWVERYQASLASFDLAARFRVDPGGTGEGAGAEGDRIPIRIVPGRAFGTGEHATTRLCAGLLERRVRPGTSWLDLGCGTGILGVAAHHLGAGRVLGVDTDAEAVAVAREVVAANGLAGRLEVRQGSIPEAAAVSWDGVVANVDLGLFLSQAPALAAILARGGTLIASGFLEPDVPSVAEALRGAGLRPASEETAEGWAAIAAERGAE